MKYNHITTTFAPHQLLRVSPCPGVFCLAWLEKMQLPSSHRTNGLVQFGFGIAGIVLHQLYPITEICTSLNNHGLPQKSADLSLWMLVFSVSAIAIGLFNLSMAVSISLWRNSLFKMFVKLCELFYLVWIIIGNVWIFWFTPITTFGTSNSTSSNTTTPPLNTTTSNSTATTNDLNCALLEGHAFAFMIAFWIVSCVVVCLLGDNAEEERDHLILSGEISYRN